MRSKAGLVAEFDSPERLVAATEAMKSAGHRHLEAYSPFPIEELPELPWQRPPLTPLYALVFGSTGAIFAYVLQWWINVYDYPLNVGGFPLHSAPNFIPITFETTVLFGACAAFLGLFIHLRLPRLHHPIFDVDGFERATRDRYFLAIAADDPLFDTDRVRRALLELQALRVSPFGRLA